MERDVRAYWLNDENEEIEYEATLNDEELMAVIKIFDTALERD